jgi:hypothetical protein
MHIGRRLSARSPAGGQDRGMTPQEWLSSFAALLGVDPPDEATIDTLLDLAGVAAHASERTAAPIACWLVGLSGLDAATALERAERVTVL